MWLIVHYFSHYIYIRKGTYQADELPVSNYLRNRLSFQEQSAH